MNDKKIRLVNEITMIIVRNVRDGESIHSLANRIGFAYSAVHKWVLELEKYEIINLIRKGNRNVIRINQDNFIYKGFKELDDAVSVITKDNAFWELAKNLRLGFRFVKGTAATIWTQGGFITGDFYDRIYFLEVEKKDVEMLKGILDKNRISYTENIIGKQRPLIFISKKEEIKIERKDGLPVMPLNELVSWCKQLHFDNILEHLDNLYNLGLKVKYAEVWTNA